VVLAVSSLPTFVIHCSVLDFISSL
jgi:hypothetical protein